MDGDDGVNPGGGSGLVAGHRGVDDIVDELDVIEGCGRRRGNAACLVPHWDTQRRFLPLGQSNEVLGFRLVDHDLQLQRGIKGKERREAKEIWWPGLISRSVGFQLDLGVSGITLSINLEIDEKTGSFLCIHERKKNCFPSPFWFRISSSLISSSKDQSEGFLICSVLRMTDLKGSTSTAHDACVRHKEWDEISCPICMDHPHNAVLLICSSHEKGCRSYICDTSYRHSNCLDRFKRSRVDQQDNASLPGFSVHGNADGQIFNPEAIDSSSQPISEESGIINLLETSEDFIMEENDTTSSAVLPDVLGNDIDIQEQSVTDERINREESGEQETVKPDNLKCPLCRGTVVRWMIAKEARQYLDLKTRSCSRESCTFSGNYRELRRHARRDHPTTRPAEVDPSRQRAWRRMEHQREYGDIISAIRSAMPGAIVFGDYVLDGGEGLPLDRDLGEGDVPWWTTLFFLRMISSPNGSLNGRRGLSRSWRMHQRSSRRRYLWGENLLGLQDEDEEDGDVRILDEEDVSIPRRRRRRFVRARTDELP
ncbi:hypothetical protein J5N97_023498 [Dioscorea zingiberensis]|uniref:Uncharacterized protein n=1 Tax=Dioscorea zingiberensis TaxID=325984 RepID=A0A9D5C4K3_9LILI|nr:hypothetical protein J5N97_023498 [Dioscorea zingiberensis]